MCIRIFKDEFLLEYLFWHLGKEIVTNDWVNSEGHQLALKVESPLKGVNWLKWLRQVVGSYRQKKNCKCSLNRGSNVVETALAVGLMTVECVQPVLICQRMEDQELWRKFVGKYQDTFIKFIKMYSFIFLSFVFQGPRMPSASTPTWKGSYKAGDKSPLQWAWR